jgi:phosphotriesterase-related protein
MISLVKQGYADRIMLSHDSILVWLGRPMNPPAEWAVWYPTYIHKKLIPKMKAAGVTDEQVNTILVDNPRRLFEEA